LLAQTRTTLKTRNTSIDKHLQPFLLKTPHLIRISAHLYYDDLNRVTRTITYDDNGANTTTTRYQGYTQTHTNPKSQVRIDIRDAIGRIEQVTDAKAGITRFSYDPFGNLTQTIDPNGNVITVAYDPLGRKTRLTDPNLGRIDYFIDARGLTWKQISPKQRPLGQFSRTEYDLLGRMTGRYEPDLESHWVYDTASKGIGQLSEAYTGSPTNKDYRRTHSYDSLGRPSLTSQFLTDGTYTSLTAYDAYGRIITTEYQRNTNPKKTFAHRYNNWGYLSQLQRGNLILWQVRQHDAQRNPTDIRLGNGLIQQREYDKKANRLKSATLKTADGLNTNPINRLKEDYQYDALGNVTLRSQYWDQNGFSETFGYDELNRIIQSQVSGQAQQVFTYDAVGNLTSKTGVGTANGNQGATYQYPVQGANAIRPHAVDSIPGIGSFGYDDNGNLTSGAGRTLTWTSFDMPNSITKAATQTTPAASANFVYGPEHQRTRQTKTEGTTTTTVIYAGAQEVETKAGVTTIKTYWPYGVGVEIDRNLSGNANPNNNTSELNWTHTDRLGSPVAMSTSTGTLREKLAYDAWGKRRTLDGAPINGTPTPDNLDGQTDNRGFTGHEMLDGLDLVHMNGRIYDPLTARFMSADPILQDPMNGQSYNRYTYVMNNPTNFTDPTGFSRIEAMREDAMQRIADRFARSDDATKTAATEKYGAGMVNAILGVAKGGITAETVGAVMNAAGQMKESAKNKAAAVAGSVGGAINEAASGVANTFTTVGQATAAYTAFGVGIATGDNSLRDVGANAVEEDQSKIVMAFANLPAMGRLPTPTAVVSNVVQGGIKHNEKKSEALSNDRGTKAVNLPAFNKVTVDMSHIKDRHMQGGTLTDGRTVFSSATERGVQAAIQQAYGSARTINVQGDRVLLSGTTKTGTQIEMWFNKSTKTIETAYPVAGK
jgi:RHS repeat-associated protein